METARKTTCPHRDRRDKREAYREILERCPERKVLYRTRQIPSVRERVHRQRLGRTKPNVQEHKWFKKKGIAKKVIQTLRAIMISQEVDLVAGDFNGTALHCRSRNNLSTIDAAFLIVPCLRHRAPHRCGDPDPFRTTGQTSVDLSDHRVLNGSGE